jgi:hypothetical protein
MKFDKEMSVPFRHFKNRAYERFGIEIKSQDWLRLASDLKERHVSNSHYIWSRDDSKAFRVIVDGKVATVIYRISSGLPITVY